ncbi:MAG: hypothetical protein K6T88_12395 [Bacillus sp. (in: Bacteria)]|nr:hypothetical protein [Bacillus sp. (in: firmicutes)]
MSKNWSLILFFSVILVACNNQTIKKPEINLGNPTSEETPARNDDVDVDIIEVEDSMDLENVLDTERFIHLLEAKGYMVIKPKLENGTPHTFFSVYPTSYEVDQKGIGIFEYKNEEDAKKDSKTISKDGGIIGNTIIDWIDKPNFYLKGKIIVSYIGSDSKLQKDLDGILGTSITN